MTHEHIHLSSPEQLYNQVKGQIDRVEEFLKTDMPQHAAKKSPEIFQK
jgi:hypothetical protein